MTGTSRPAEITFYWRPGCPFCWMLRRSLLRSAVILDERNIWKDPDAAAFVQSVTGGDETVPTVVVAGTALVNPRAATVLALLEDPNRDAPPRSSLLRRLFRRSPAP